MAVRTVYRMAVDAQVYFSIEADSEEEAKASAQEFIDECLEPGNTVDVGDRDYDVRVYLANSDTPDPSLTVEDIEEEECQDDTAT